MAGELLCFELPQPVVFMLSLSLAAMLMSSLLRGSFSELFVCVCAFSLVGTLPDLLCNHLVLLVVSLVGLVLLTGLAVFLYWWKRKQLRQRIRVIFLTSDLDLHLGLTRNDLEKKLGMKKGRFPSETLLHEGFLKRSNGRYFLNLEEE